MDPAGSNNNGNHDTSKGNLELFGSRERAHYEVEESRMSFPSGHAAHSFQAVTFMILYLQVCFCNVSPLGVGRIVDFDGTGFCIIY